MRVRRFVLSGMLSILFSFTAGPVSADEPAAGSSRLKIMVSILPQVMFVERIGGERVDVEAIVQPGRDPHTYEMTPRQMASLSEADLFFRIGVPFENGVIPQLERSVPKLPIVDLRKGIRLMAMEHHDHDHEESPHTHEAGSQHDHMGMDPHIWLDPDRIAIQAKTICDALIDIDPGNRELYLSNLGKFEMEIRDADDAINRTLSSVTQRRFMVFHPSWGYFADSYDLVQIAVEVEGKSPAARQLARTIDRAKAEGIRVIIVQPQFSRKSAESVASAIGGSVVAIDPLQKDVFAAMRELASVIQGASGK